MKGITKQAIEKDLGTVKELLSRYQGAFYEDHREAPSHMDQQLPLIRKAVGDAACGLGVAERALSMLNDIKDELVED